MKRQPLNPSLAQQPTLEPTPVSALLVRAALGMALMLGGGALTWAATIPAITGQLEATRTARTVDLQAGDTLRLDGDRTSLSVSAGHRLAGEGVTLEASHRALNPLTIETDGERAGERAVTVGLHTEPESIYGMMISLQPSDIAAFIPSHEWPAQLQHTLGADVGVGGLYLHTSSRTGPQKLDLSGLQVAGLEAESVTGDITLTLPKAAAEAVTVQSQYGRLTVSGSAAGTQEPVPLLGLSTEGGDIQADLSAAAVQRLEVDTDTGDVVVSLPTRAVTRLSASIQVGDGEHSVDIPASTYGELDIGSAGELVVTVDSAAAYAIRLEKPAGGGGYDSAASSAAEGSAAEFAARLPPRLSARGGMWYSPAALQQLEGESTANILYITFTPLSADSELNLLEGETAATPQ